MDFIKYNIKEGSSLESIAKEKGVSVKELLDFHNSNASITEQIYADYIPFHIKSLFLPGVKAARGDFEYDKSYKRSNARYRTEQVNITRIEEEVKSYSKLKKRV